MGERAKQIGDKLEEFGEKLYQDFGWIELLRGKEIQCNRSSHKNSDGKKKKTHGVDLLHTCYDPYRNQNQAIITECKNYEWKSIIPSNIEKWVEELVNNLDCAANDVAIGALSENFDTINTGILFIHANDGKYDKNIFYDYLDQIKFPIKRSSQSIYIASDNKFNEWIAMFDYINSNLKPSNSKETTQFKFVYPSIGPSKYYEQDCITVNHLFSRFVFGKRVFMKEDKSQTKSGMCLQKPCEQSIIFSFDSFSIDSFRYLYGMFKHFQFEKADEYIFCFYPQTVNDIEYTKKEFIKSLKTSPDKFDIDESKILLEFLKNPEISRVDNYK